VRDADGSYASARRGGGRSPPSREPWQALVAPNEAYGLAIHARTGLPSWCGERLDLGWAIGVLHPACNPGLPRQEPP
jgi:hypothetical protein